MLPSGYTPIDMTNERTSIASLGKFALLDHLVEGFPREHSSTLVPSVDDAAVVGYAEGLRTVSTTKLLLEGIHFDLTYTPLRHLGYKAVVATLSSVCAMNARPRQLMLSLGVSGRFAVEDLEELYAGIRLATEAYHIDLISHDISSSLTGLTLSLTALGEVAEGELVLRSGAQPTDLVCCTGDLGSAFMGLQLLEREKRVFAGQTGDFDPDFAGHEYILERQLRPNLRLGVLGALAAKGIRPTSLTVLADGLASQLLHLARSSGVGLRIYEDRLPIDYETAKMAEELNMNLLSVALSGGEDYEFVFTVPLGLMDQVKDIEGIRFIGHVTTPDLGACIVGRDGTEIELRDQGWVAQSE